MKITAIEGYDGLGTSTGLDASLGSLVALGALLGLGGLMIYAVAAHPSMLQNHSSRERHEMQELLRQAGYSSQHARRLMAEGMGPEELRARLREPAGLERTHRIKTKAKHSAKLHPNSESQSRAMTKSEVEYEFLNSIPAHLRRDVPAAQERWSLILDALHREGMISDHQVQNWDQPKWLREATPSSLERKFENLHRRSLRRSRSR